MKMKSEKRYYIVNSENSDVTPHDDIEYFMEEAENNGTVYTESGFEEAYNDLDITNEITFLKILTLVKCDCGWNGLEKNLNYSTRESLNGRYIYWNCPKCNEVFSKTKL